MAIQKNLSTVAEFEALSDLPENAGRRFELIDGEIIEKMPSQLHAYIVAVLSSYFFSYLQQNPLGWALIKACYQLPGDTHNAYIPDLSFVRSTDRTLIEEGPAPYMPDLAIEVQSPGQSDKFMSDKADYYLAHGSHMVWLVYPQKRLVESLTHDTRYLLTPADTLTGGDVLPGFEVSVQAIFPAE